eukprot:3959136-Prymnesium_polylepis.6
MALFRIGVCGWRVSSVDPSAAAQVVTWPSHGGTWGHVAVTWGHVGSRGRHMGSHGGTCGHMGPRPSREHGQVREQQRRREKSFAACGRVREYGDSYTRAEEVARGGTGRGAGCPHTRDPLAAGSICRRCSGGRRPHAGTLHAGPRTGGAGAAAAAAGDAIATRAVLLRRATVV